MLSKDKNFGSLKGRKFMQTELFESAFKFSGIGFALTSANGKCMKANRALSTILGYSEEELLTLDFMQVTHPDDLPADLLDHTPGWSQT